MGLIFGNANADLVKGSLNRFVAMGEKAKGDDFQMKVADYPNFELLVQAGQMPPIKREMVEIVGPHGVQVQQQGKIINAGEIPITFIETINGALLEILKNWVGKKEYHTVAMAMVSEGQPVSGPSTTCVMEGCWIESEAIEFSVEDNVPLKPTATLHYNWAGWYGADDLVGTVLSWIL